MSMTEDNKMHAEEQSAAENEEAMNAEYERREKIAEEKGHGAVAAVGDPPD